ncbi:transglycosylase domain-containing protein [Peptacetobacter hiranonis]|uniref:transglycosylase domain-containing protein n=1 Tax=Peptacetobacter hiranonis TaxID=89152 RepID=UPI0022E02D29|nr:biosynthetic peptidoglycan transglycosylase [Peptacetobacter hiranonis]
MFNNSNENKVRRRNVSSSGGSSSNRIRRPDNSYDEERLRENTKSKPLFERTANDDFKRGNTGRSALSRKNGERLQPRTNRGQNNRENLNNKEKEYDHSMLPSERKKRARENANFSNSRMNDSRNFVSDDVKFNYGAREKERESSRDREIIKKTRKSSKNKKNKKKEIKSKVFYYVSRIVAMLLVLCIVAGACGIGYAKYVTKDMPEVTAKMVHEKYISSKEAPIKDMPKNLRNAIVAIEDERFYKHDGVDKKALARSLIHNILTDSRQGGSTIEMQLSKNLLTSSEVSIKRKIMDMYNAVGMNRVMKKDEILEAYLNNIYFGQNAYGVAAGAELYFGKNVKDLDLAESAMLVGITNNPKIYSNYSAAKTRQKIILKKMYELGYIKEAQYKEAVAEMVHFRSEIE